MVWFDRDPLSLLRAGTGFDAMFRAAEGLTCAVPRVGTEAARPRASSKVGAFNVEVDAEASRLVGLVPGFGPDDLELTARDRALRVQGHRDDGRSFERSFRLPWAVDADGVTARVEDGVLWLELPRRADDRPHRIAIEGATTPELIEAPTSSTPSEDDADETAEATTELAEAASTPEVPRPVTARPRAFGRRTDEGFELTVQIPGARRDSIALDVEDGELRLSADTALVDLTSTGNGASFREFRPAGRYEGRWALPEDVDVDAATSRYERGELVVTVPARKPQRRTIAVD